MDSMMLFFAIAATALFQLGLCFFCFYMKQSRTVWLLPCEFYFS